MDNRYSQNPEELLRGPVADIVLDLENPLILEVGTHARNDLSLIIVGAPTMCWDRNAHHLGRRTVFWPYDEGDLRHSALKGRGRLVRRNSLATASQHIETTYPGTTLIRSTCHIPQSM